MPFYNVKFHDSRNNKKNWHYVETRDMEEAKKLFETEEPYVKVLEYYEIALRDVPQVAVVIRK